MRVLPKNGYFNEVIKLVEEIIINSYAFSLVLDIYLQIQIQIQISIYGCVDACICKHTKLQTYFV